MISTLGSMVLGADKSTVLDLPRSQDSNLIRPRISTKEQDQGSRNIKQDNWTQNGARSKIRKRGKIN